MAEQETKDSTMIHVDVKKKSLPIILKYVIYIGGAIGAAFTGWQALKSDVVENTARIDVHEGAIEMLCIQEEAMAAEVDEVSDDMMLTRNDMQHLSKTVEKMAVQVDAMYQRQQ